MSKSFDIPIWKTAPCLQLLLPLVTGIILQWYVQPALQLIILNLVCFTSAYWLFSKLPVAVKFKLHFMQGMYVQLIIISIGMFVTWQKDSRHKNNWYGQYYTNGDYIIASISEPLIEKAKSYKADVFIEQLIRKDSAIKGKGKLLLYFSKDSIPNSLQYGDQILIHKNLQEIKNSGNPGAFNYQRYAAFQQTFHNAYLKPTDWVKLPGKKASQFKQFIYSARAYILSILQKNVGSNKDELGIAEALLIGYTNDLDKDLVQAYSNTGVVHIIAISGMHLGLIYVMLVWLFKRIPGINQSKIVQVILILSCLWLFSLLTGASASVCRAAVMFTFITVGKNIGRNSSIYNSLAASALVMLCYNPYYLWDVGFQLSYLAVVGIVVFQKPIYNWFYIKNKYLDGVWKLAAISLAAQTLTFPICIYYFHQFPNLFLLTNIIAVPLSSVILYATIALIALSHVPYLGFYLGKLVNGLVWLMNQIILKIDDFPYTVWDKIPATIVTTWLLYFVVIGVSCWLLRKSNNWFRFSVFSLLAFAGMHTFNTWQINNQQHLIVYNVPQHRAIDFVKGNNYQFVGDSILLQDGVLQNFHLKPGRIALQLNNRIDSLSMSIGETNFYQFGNKKMLLIDRAISFEKPLNKIEVDYIIISKSPRLYIPQLAEAFNCRQYVFDASNSVWKIDKWQKDCEQLHLQHYSIPMQGAFIAAID